MSAREQFRGRHAGYVLKNALDLEFVDAIREVAAGNALSTRGYLSGWKLRPTRLSSPIERDRSSSTYCGRPIQQGDRRRSRSQR